MLAVVRAELLVLRKWPAALGLLLVAPATPLLTYYLVQFVDYRTETPAQYAQLGNPSQLLPGLLPSQFVIEALIPFYAAVAPFVVLGAVMAGGDWGRGTIGTSLTAGAGRVRAGAGQALAMVVALAASVLVTFVVSGAASLVIRTVEAKAVNPAAGAWPPAWVLVRALGVALLIAVAYGSMGLALGTVCRSASGAVAAALLWTVIIEPNLYDLGTQAGGTLQAITDVFPATSEVTLTSLFSPPGSQNYLPISPAVATWTMAGYTAAFLILTLVLLHRRDVLAGRTGRPGRPPAARRAPRLPALISLRTHGVLASVRAELLVMRRRPAVWALVLIVPVNMLISSYLTDFVFYRSAGTSLGTNVSAPQLLQAMLPGQYLAAALSGFGAFSGVDGLAVFLLLGALVAGSDWGRGTIKTALLQGPGRLQSRVGQDLAVMLAAAAAVVLTFLAAAAAAAVAAGLAGSALPQASGFPAVAHVAAAVAGGLILALVGTAIGLALGTIVRSATKAAAAVLLWFVIIQPSLDQVSTQLHGVLLTLYELLPDAGINTLVDLYTTTFIPGTSDAYPGGAEITPALAFVTLSLYIVVFLTIPALITTRRNIT